ncbi:MAG: site-2 protease family protein, partial [Candidatus Levybacteria bacterium]|nr:site-2 protease family protein [Candidatus Levybacteria bacterium]
MEMLLLLLILIYSAILHEIAHGYVADRLGDPTARLSGRLTLNPIPHIDPFMTILLPLLLIMSGSPIIFGGAKPVPVDPFNLKEGRKDIAIVAL